eukprot:4426061-Amphidinium_carterae.2
MNQNGRSQVLVESHKCLAKLLPSCGHGSAGAVWSKHRLLAVVSSLLSGEILELGQGTTRVFGSPQHLLIYRILVSHAVFAGHTSWQHVALRTICVLLDHSFDGVIRASRAHVFDDIELRRSCWHVCRSKAVPEQRHVRTTKASPNIAAHI